MSVLPRPQVLVIDDDFGDSPSLQADFVRLVDPARRCDFSFCSGQEDGRNAISMVETKVDARWPPLGDGHLPWSLVLLDVNFPQREPRKEDSTWGFVLLETLRSRWPDLPIVMLTSEDIAKKSRANWGQADGFLPKPAAADADVDDAFATRLYSFGLFPDLRGGRRLAGRSLPLLRALQEARRFACDPLGSGRILYGETGTGKTELARFIHDEMELLTGRSGPFVSWSAAGANEDITKAALFGQWEGAFTDAKGSEPGQIERAHRGTFFLDEVSSLSPGAQALFIESRRRDQKLRRLISRMGKFPDRETGRKKAEESVVPQPWREHLQRDHRIAVDVVILTASNLNLHDEEVSETVGFRRDLLNDLGAPIYLPGLNERREDIPEIFSYIVQEIVEHLGRPAKQVDERVMAELQTRDWTRKNVVTLRQIAEHAVIAARDFDEILLRHLPQSFDVPNWAGSRPPTRETTAVPVARIDGHVGESPRTLADLSKLLEEFEVPGDQRLLEGSLPTLQAAYGKLALRLLGAALRATRDRRGETSSLRAVCKLLGVNELRGTPQSYAAYDVVLRLLGLCDARFEGLPAERCELLSDEPEVVERVRHAVQQRRTKRTKKVTS